MKNKEESLNRDIKIWLLEGKQTRITQLVKKVTEEIEGEGVDYVLNSVRWIRSNLKNIKCGEENWEELFRSRTVNEILRDKTVTGCSDIAVVFVSLMRVKGIPTRYIFMLEKEWVEDDKIGGFRNHDVSMIYLNNRWQYVDPTTGKVGPRSHVIETDKYKLLNKGLDSWDLDMNSWGSYKQKMIAYRDKSKR